MNTYRAMIDRAIAEVDLGLSVPAAYLTTGPSTVPEPTGAASLLEQIEAMKARIEVYKPPDVVILTPSWDALEAEFAKRGLDVAVGAGDHLAASISGIKVVVIPELSRPVIVPAEMLRSPDWLDTLKGLL